MEETSRFTWNSVIILFLTALICVLGFWFYDTKFPASDAVRGVLASLLAAVFSLILFYYVDPRMRRPDYYEVMSKSGFRRVLRNAEFGPHFWVDLISDLSKTESHVFLVGKRLSEWRRTPTYKQPLQLALQKRAARASECRNAQKYRTTIVVEDPVAHQEWTEFISPFHPSVSRIEIVLASCGSLPYGLTICGERMAIVHYVGNRSTGDNPTIDVLPDSPVWKLYSDDIHELLKSTIRS